MRRHLVLLSLSLGPPLSLGFGGPAPTRAAQLPAPAARAQSGVADEPLAARDEDSIDRRRVLTLADGGWVRARTRKLGQRWERRSGPVWEEVAGEVVRARSERELLAQARRMQGLAPESDPAARSVLASWLLDQGLCQEALAELDRLLAGAPAYPAALRCLEDERLELELEGQPRAGSAESVLALLLAGARSGPATRELCARRLAALEPALDLEAMIRAELVIAAPRRRVFAARLAQRLRPTSFLSELCDRAILDLAPSVREAAAQAMGASREVGILAPAIQALSSEHPAIRLHATQAMGHMGFLAAVEPLVASLAALQAGGPSSAVRANLFVGFQTAYVKDYDVEIAQAAAIADPILAVQDSGVMFDVSAIAQITQVVEMQATMRSLHQLTGAAPGDGSPQAWLDWWAETQASWRGRGAARVGDASAAVGER